MNLYQVSQIKAAIKESPDLTTKLRNCRRRGSYLSGSRNIADYLHHSRDGINGTTMIRETTWPDNVGNIPVTGKTHSEQYENISVFDNSFPLVVPGSDRILFIDWQG